MISTFSISHARRRKRQTFGVDGDHVVGLRINLHGTDILHFIFVFVIAINHIIRNLIVLEKGSAFKVVVGSSQQAHRLTCYARCRFCGRTERSQVSADCRSEASAVVPQRRFSRHAHITFPCNTKSAARRKSWIGS